MQGKREGESERKTKQLHFILLFLAFTVDLCSVGIYSKENHIKMRF